MGAFRECLMPEAARGRMSESAFAYARHLVYLHLIPRVQRYAKALHGDVTIRGGGDDVLIHSPPPGTATAMRYPAYVTRLVAVVTVVTGLVTAATQASGPADLQAAAQAATQLLASPHILALMIQKPLERPMQRMAAGGEQCTVACTAMMLSTVVSMDTLIR
jgi:hypothetical protein